MVYDMQKRGISELIATVLIIGFTVALGAIVIIWGVRFVSETRSEVDVSAQMGVSCTKVNFDIRSVDCSSGSITSINIINKADEDIADFIIRITDINNQASLISTSNSPLTSFSSSTISLSGTPINPKKVELIPQILGVNNEIFACTAAKTEFNINEYYDNGECRTGGGCSPGATELCDNFDNDCDAGTVDGSGESWYGQATNCGVGECSSSGILTCSGGSQVNTCAPGTPSAEICDGLDNDCNSQADEGGVSLCDDSSFCNGIETCQGGSCVSPGNPCVAGETCNEQDDVCGISLTSSSCGIPSGGWQAGKTYYLANNVIGSAADIVCFPIAVQGVTIDCTPGVTRYSITTTASGSHGVRVTGNLISATVKDCTINTPLTSVGIGISSTTSLTAINNIITTDNSASSRGITVQITTGTQQRTILLTNNIISSQIGIYLQSNVNLNPGSGISNNTISASGTGIYVSDFSGVINIPISGNSVCGGTSKSIRIDSINSQMGSYGTNYNLCDICDHQWPWPSSSNICSTTSGVGICDNVC